VNIVSRGACVNAYGAVYRIPHRKPHRHTARSGDDLSASLTYSFEFSVYVALRDFHFASAGAAIAERKESVIKQ